MRQIYILQILSIESKILDKQVQKLSNLSTKGETPSSKRKKLLFVSKRQAILLLIRHYREANLGGKITRSKTH